MNTTQKNSELKRAPSPGGNFVKIAVDSTVKGNMTEARMEVEEIKSKKGKGVQTKERYFFSLTLTEPATLLVGKKKIEKKVEFKEGDTVILPDHGFLVTTMRRTACEIAGLPYVPNENTDLKPLVGKYFEITRREDGIISSGQFSGTASALYDIQYGEGR